MSDAAWTADCMEPAEWADWSRFNSRLSGAKAALRPCDDCLPEFAAEMRAENRCNGVPLGAVRHEEEPMPEPITLAGKRQPVTVIAPCGTCAHAEVCRIRPSLEGIRSLSVIAPETDSAISFGLSANVTCDFYAKAKAAPKVTSAPTAGRSLNLSDEDRERRRQQILRVTADRKAAREAEATAG